MQRTYIEHLLRARKCDVNKDVVLVVKETTRNKKSTLTVWNGSCCEEGKQQTQWTHRGGSESNQRRSSQGRLLGGGKA